MGIFLTERGRPPFNDNDVVGPDTKEKAVSSRLFKITKTKIESKFGSYAPVDKNSIIDQFTVISNLFNSVHWLLLQSDILTQV